MNDSRRAVAPRFPLQTPPEGLVQSGREWHLQRIIGAVVKECVWECTACLMIFLFWYCL